MPMHARARCLAALLHVLLALLPQGMAGRRVRLRRSWEASSSALSASLSRSATHVALGTERAATSPLSGMSLGGYRLLSELHTKPIESQAQAAAFLETGDDLVPPSEFESKKWKLTKSIGFGSFGAAYLAEPHDCKNCSGDLNDPSSEYVVLKFVYKKEDDEYKFATMRDVQEAEDDELKLAVDDMMRECSILKSMDAPNAQARPRGHGKIVKCYQACCPDCDECNISEDEPVHVVLDYAGMDGADWFELHNSDKRAFADVLTQVMQGLDYLAHLTPPVVHHDLKWANLAIKESRRRVLRQVKIIDFGGALRWKGDESKEDVVITEDYEPPESHFGFAYQGPPHAFDTFSLGIMALESLCSYGDDESIEAVRQETWKDYSADPRTDPSDYLEALDLKDPKQARCVSSMGQLLHGDPWRRPKPHWVAFDRNGARVKQMGPTDGGMQEKPSLFGIPRLTDLRDAPLKALNALQNHGGV